MKLQKDLREFIELLNSRAVEYVVVGAHALAFHGHPRFTGDIDLLVRMTPENTRRVGDVLREFGFTDLAADDGLLSEEGVVVQLGVSPNRIDLMTSITGVSFDEAWADSAHGTLDGIAVRFLGRESLLRNKRATGRLKDLADAEELGGD